MENFEYATLKKQRQAGFTLIEVLISILVLAIVVLGVAAMQLHALRTTQQSGFHTAALQMAGDLAEQMRAWSSHVKQEALSNPYLTLTYDPPQGAISGQAPKLCYGRNADCNPVELAHATIYEWEKRIKDAFPGGRAVVCRDSSPWRDSVGGFVWECDNDAVASIVIKIGWQEKQQDGALIKSSIKEAPPAMAFTVGPGKK